MTHIKEIVYEGTIQEGKIIIFRLADGHSYKGEVKKCCGKYWIELLRCFNGKIFTELGIDDPSAFVSNIVGYKLSGVWPEVYSLQDLNNVLKALSAYRHPDSPKEREDKFTLAVNKHKQINLNFKL